MPVLRIKLPDNKGEITHVLAGERITIGRRPDNTIQIIDRSVSGHHAELISVNGHYRLHDLGSTNLTCVEGQPITDFHLHDSCKVNFGTVECEFSPETHVNTVEKSEVVPTRAELEFLRRENLDLQAKISGMQKQIDILSSARLMTKETQNLGVMPDVHRRVQQERDELRTKTANLELDVEHLRADLASLAKERDALRLAWETVKRERDEAMAKLGPNAVPAAQPSSAGAPPVPVPSPIDAIGGYETTRSLPDHRAMATVLTTAPGCLKSIVGALDLLAKDSTDDAAAATLAAEAETLLRALAPLGGHPAHRLASASAALVRDSRSRAGRIEPSVVTSLRQAADAIAAFLDPRVFKKAGELRQPRTLILDDEDGCVEMLRAVLDAAHFRSTACNNADKALELLRTEPFDVALFDITMPGMSGFDVCARMRENTANKSTPVIFITGADSVENRAQGTVNGGDDFVAKPMNMLEVALKAATWASRHQLGLKTA